MSDVTTSETSGWNFKIWFLKEKFIECCFLFLSLSSICNNNRLSVLKVASGNQLKTFFIKKTWVMTLQKYYYSLNKNYYSLITYPLNYDWFPSLWMGLNLPVFCVCEWKLLRHHQSPIKTRMGQGPWMTWNVFESLCQNSHKQLLLLLLLIIIIFSMN